MKAYVNLAGDLRTSGDQLVSPESVWLQSCVDAEIRVRLHFNPIASHLEVNGRILSTEVISREARHVK